MGVCQFKTGGVNPMCTAVSIVSFGGYVRDCTEDVLNGWKARKVALFPSVLRIAAYDVATNGGRL